MSFDDVPDENNITAQVALTGMALVITHTAYTNLCLFLFAAVYAASY